MGTLSQRITNQVHGLKGLNSKLLDIRSYLERVAAGKLPINHQIIYHLQDIFNLLPDVNLLVSWGVGLGWGWCRGGVMCVRRLGYVEERGQGVAGMVINISFFILKEYTHTFSFSNQINSRGMIYYFITMNR